MIGWPIGLLSQLVCSSKPTCCLVVAPEEEVVVWLESNDSLSPIVPPPLLLLLLLFQKLKNQKRINITTENFAPFSANEQNGDENSTVIKVRDIRIHNRRLISELTEQSLCIRNGKRSGRNFWILNLHWMNSKNMSKEWGRHTGHHHHSKVTMSLKNNRENIAVWIVVWIERVCFVVVNWESLLQSTRWLTSFDRSRVLKWVSED